MFFITTIAMFKYTISKADKELFGDVTLSPSIKTSSKVLVFRVLKKLGTEQKFTPDKEETDLIFGNIPNKRKSLEKGDPGKALRHLRSFFNFFKGEWIIATSKISKEKPIELIVNILQKEGINISFIERPSSTPFKLTGKGFKGNTILRVDSSISSQVIKTSLLLSPTLPYSIIAEMKDRILNSPYIELTLKALQLLGIHSEWKREEVLIESEFKDGSELAIEADWCSASYLYELAALSKKCDITIKGLNIDSIQNDSIVKELFVQLGVKTSVTSSGIRIVKEKNTTKLFDYDFTNNLNLVPTIAVTCVILKIPFKLRGVEGLHTMYGDRIKSLQSELLKLGAKISLEKVNDQETLYFNGKVDKSIGKKINISTFEDHRMVMAFAPIAITGIQVTIENPKLTSISYTSYWEDLKKLRFVIDQN